MATLIIDPEIKSLKLIDKSSLNEFMNWFLSDSSARLGKYCEIKNVAGQSVAAIDVSSSKEAEAVLSKISISSFRYLNEFIKTKFNDDYTNYNRNVILFESQVTDSRLILKF